MPVSAIQHGCAILRFPMDRVTRDFFHALFELRTGTHGRPLATSNSRAPETIPDPETGRPLKVASLELSERGICPACTHSGAGAYVSFVADLRLAFACP